MKEFWEGFTKRAYARETSDWDTSTVHEQAPTKKKEIVGDAEIGIDAGGPNEPNDTMFAPGDSYRGTANYYPGGV